MLKQTKKNVIVCLVFTAIISWSSKIFNVHKLLDTVEYKVYAERLLYSEEESGDTRMHGVGMLMITLVRLASVQHDCPLYFTVGLNGVFCACASR